MPSAPAAAALAAAPRVVFFGPPHAGKTALIAAFRAAAGRQSRPPTDPDAGPKDVVTHPLHVSAAEGGPPGWYVLLDTDGSANRTILSAPELLAPAAGRRPITGELYAADGIILTLDASADDAATGELFRSFADFLDGLEESRAFGREVGGLPVFVTLTKCDHLWRPGQTPAEWRAEVERRKREVRQQFEAYFGGGASGRAGPRAFGGVEPRAAATATRFPDAPGFDALGDGPFGVLDLFEAALAAARDHRTRVLRSGRRLQLTLGGAGTLVAALLAGLGLLTLAGTAGDSDPLAARVRAFQVREGPPAAYLSDRRFEPNQTELAAVRAAPGFNRLPDDLRQYVDDRLAEFADYKAFRDLFAPPRPGPADAVSLDDLDRLEADLTTTAVVPPQYRPDWDDTEAARLRDKWLADVRLLRQAEATLHDWYRGLDRRATELLLAPAVDAGWRAKLDALRKDAETPPFPRREPIPGSERLSLRRGGEVRYAQVFEFDRVDGARRDWEAARDRAARLEQVATLLDTVLNIPEPTADAEASLALAADRVSRLLQQFPDANLDLGDWAATTFPDPIRSELRRRLREAFAAGVRHVHSLLRAKFPALAGGRDTTAAWKRAADWLVATPAARDWGRLLRVIDQLAADGTAAKDPVAEFAAFMNREWFDLALAGFRLALPDDLRTARAVPAGRLVVTHTPAGGPAKEYPFRRDGEPDRDGAASVYRFAPDGHDGKLVYRPGDGLTATLPLTAGGQEYRLEWADGRAAAFQFDRLLREPTLRRADAPAEPAVNVRLVPTPEGRLPAVPVLVPGR